MKDGFDFIYVEEEVLESLKPVLFNFFPSCRFILEITQLDHSITFGYEIDWTFLAIGYFLWAAIDKQMTCFFLKMV